MKPHHSISSLKKIIEAFERNKTEFPELFSNRKKLSNLTGSWFVGPKFENGELLKNTLQTILESNKEFRDSYHPEDPEYVTHHMKNTPEYRDDISDFKFELQKVLQALKVSTPFYSYRSLGHMNWEISIPAIAGYFAGMLYNQNNVALEASPATTAMERSVAHDLCAMLGYSTKKNKNISWGHITCDGSVANIESVWASRNLKYFPVGICELIKNQPELKNASSITINHKKLINLTTWELLNLTDNESLSLTDNILELCTDLTDEILNTWLKPFLVQEIGMLQFYTKYLQNTNLPVIIGPASAHYSWPKASAIMGIGAENFIRVPLDKQARMDVSQLDAILKNCNKSKIPVIEVVAVIGTTEEGAIDNFDEIFKLKEKYSKLGLNFHLHADAAWGGYFASCLKENKIVNTNIPGFVPNLSLSNYSTKQFKALSNADTITIDPHKAGYIPYPAGSLCYKDSRLKNLISFIPSYIDHGSNEPSMGLFGIEGSKPGAAAASVFLSHKVMPPNVNGIGKVLGESLFSTKYFYAELVGLEHPKFSCFPIVEPISGSKDFVKKNIIGKTNHEIYQNEEAMNWLKENGQDTTIISYFFNFKNQDGTLNNNIDKMNQFNEKIYEKLSIPPGASLDDISKNLLFVTSSEFDIDIYGENFIKHQMIKAGINLENKPLTFLISTIMCPWITATEKGNYYNQIMDDILQAIDEVYTELTK